MADETNGDAPDIVDDDGNLDEKKDETGSTKDKKYVPHYVKRARRNQKKRKIMKAQWRRALNTRRTRRKDTRRHFKLKKRKNRPLH
mmetsp:Transcript_1087/g.1440  ORF Transcript_1087/g.1440 Transcript_1087/m.1440 type:complete len:86 (+) Transcript_1087:103-360(+)